MRIVDSLKDYIANFYATKNGKKYLLPEFKHHKKQNDNELNHKWFCEVIKEAERIEFVDFDTLNDVWDLDISGLKIHRLLHDHPSIDADIKWIRPKKGEKAALNYKDRQQEQKSISIKTILPEILEKGFYCERGENDKIIYTLPADIGFVAFTPEGFRVEGTKAAIFVPYLYMDASIFTNKDNVWQQSKTKTKERLLKKEKTLPNK